MQNKMIRVWITQYALTQGILEAEVVHCVDISEGMVRVPKGVYGTYELCVHKPNWHTSLKEANDRVELLLQRKQAALEKQLKNMRHLREKSLTVKKLS